MNRSPLLLALLLAAPAVSQVQPVVRAEVTPREVAVGEPVSVRIAVLGPTWFPKPPRFPSAELANAITRLPPDSSYATSERIDGELWSGVVRVYQIYPLMGASYRLAGESIGVTYAQPGSIEGTTVDVPLPEIAFRATVPAGAEALDPYVAGRSLTLERRIEGEPGSLEAGGALVVSYVAELDGLPAIFLPPLVDFEEVPGVSVYPDQPVVEDGEPARRTERYTFVFEAGGDFVIPGASLDWWNREAGRIEAAGVEPVTVSVAGDPLSVPAEPQPPEPVDWRRILVLMVLAAVAWQLLSRLMPGLRAVRDAARRRRLASEKHAFHQLEKALLGRDRSRAHSALLEWLGRIAPGSGLAGFAERYGDGELRDELEKTSRTLYRDGGGEVHLKRLVIPFEKARRRVLREREERVKHALPPLNP